MNDELTFAQPVWIWIGLAVCILLAFGAARWNRHRERDLKKIAHSRLLRQLTDSVSRRRRHLKQGLWITGLFCVFLAMARPQYGFEFREVKRRGIDLVFAVDTSRSMLAEDVVPNRLERSRLAITDFVQKLEGDRVGLIPFAGNAFSLCPLTLDYSAFFQSLDALDTSIIPHQGTDLASAVREANRLFDEEGNNHRILILITDGEDLQGSVMAAVANAKEKGMTIHTVGVGDPTGALIPITMQDGSQDFVRDEAGQPVRTALDEDTLREISEATGGIYAPLGSAGQGLETIYQEKLRLLPKSDLNQRLDQIPLERYEWPLAAGILLLLLEFVLGERRRARPGRARVVSAARRRSAMATATILAIGLLPLVALAEAETDPRAIYNSGTEAYRAGDFATAEEDLSEGLGATDDLSLQQRGYYNLGNARYRLGEATAEENPEATIKKWESAVKSYEDALALNPDDDDARFNRDFVKEKLEELKKQQKQQKQQNQQQENQSQENQKQQQQGGGEQENQDPPQQENQGTQDSGEPQQEPGDGDQDSEPKDSNEASESEGEDRTDKASKPEGESGEEQSEDQQPGSEGNEEGSQERQSGRSGEQPKNQDQADQNQPPAEPSEESESAEEPSSSEPKQSTTGEKSEDPQKDPSTETVQAAPPQAGEPSGEEISGPPSSFSEERRQPGEMSQAEAAQLLEALEDDERSVMPIPDERAYRSVVPNNTTRGKTW